VTQVTLCHLRFTLDCLEQKALPMTIGEQFRNLVERNRFYRIVEPLSEAIGAIPAYRRVIMRRVHRRIEHVRRQRCYGLVIELSSVCNARCVFCPHPTNGTNWLLRNAPAEAIIA
jgi:hypothetical protein